MPVLKVQKADGTYDIIQTSGLSGSEIIVSATQPAGVPDGALWLDTSDNEFQGTIYDEIKGDLDSMVKTRIEFGEFQYYDGGWKSVGGMITTKPRVADYYATLPAGGDWATVVSVSGKGILNRITATSASGCNFIGLRVTIDGVIYDFPSYSPTSSQGRTLGTTSYTTLEFVLNTCFNSSLSVELKNAGGTQIAIGCSADYSLV